MAILKVEQLGSRGVNVDKNDHEMDDNELRLAQNVVSDNNNSIFKRPGLAVFNVDDSEGSILGGTTVPLIDNFTGFAVLFLGRGGPVP